MALQDGYFFILKTIIATNNVKQIMYSKLLPPFARELKQPPPFLYELILAYLFSRCKQKNNRPRRFIFNVVLTF